MSMTLLLELFSCLCFVLLSASLLLIPQVRRLERVQSRLKQVRYDGLMLPPEPKETGSLPIRIVIGFGSLLGSTRFVQARLAESMRTTLSQAGFRGGRAFSLFLGSKVLLTIALPAIVYLVLPAGTALLKTEMAMLTAVVVGMMAPELYIKSRRKRYMTALENGLSDALDLMVICVESGLGLEPAIERVGEEIKSAHPVVAFEFEQTTNELRVVSDRRAAVLNLGLRTGLEPLKRLSSTLVQTMQYGTPLAAALRVLSAELRGETMIRFEAKAAKLPVLLTVPMIIFILPCLFLVVGGPAIVQVYAMMHG